MKEQQKCDTYRLSCNGDLIIIVIRNESTCRRSYFNRVISVDEEVTLSFWSWDFQNVASLAIIFNISLGNLIVNVEKT